MNTSNLTFFFILLMLPLLPACTGGASSDVEADRLPMLGRHDYVEKTVNGQTVVDTIYHTVGDFSFVNQDSSQITPATLDGKIYVADFFFTSCPTICPVMKTQMLRVYEEFKGHPEVALLSHSIDPEYDTVALLHDYAERLGVSSDTWHFVTGDKEAIYDIGLSSYMVTAMEDEEEPGGFIHSGAFILVDKDRRIRGMYDGTEPAQVDKLIKDMNRLLEEYQTKQAAAL
ncbi:MAG: SCO family protein [Cyclobacteriaceae bacterium]